VFNCSNSFFLIIMIMIIVIVTIIIIIIIIIISIWSIIQGRVSNALTSIK